MIKGKIYKISADDELCYIGSTKKYISKRWYDHKYDYTHRYKSCSSCSVIFDKHGIDNCKIELVENFKCDTLKELRDREAYHIKNNNCVNIKTR